MDPIDAVVRAWKAKLRREQLPGVGQRDRRTTTDPISELQEIAQSLETDLADVLAQSQTLARRCADSEAGVMEAIREGNDVTARRLLLAQQECVETLVQLETDAKVVRAMIAECEEALAEARARRAE